MSFTLEYGGTTQSLEAWGIERANLTLRSLARGELKLLVRTKNADDAPIFAYKEMVTLRQGSTVRFKGWITSLPVFASHAQEAHSYTASDGWWWLENIIFRDVSGPFYAESDTEGAYPQWPYCSMFTVGNSGMVLSIGGTWTAKTIAEIITAAVDYAANCGAPITSSLSTLDTYSFLEDGRDMSCADLIRRALNWSPASCTWWDYSGTTQSLRCASRSEYADVTVELGGAVAQSWELSPRYDMQVTSVLLYIVRSRRRSDGTEFKSLSLEGSAPAWPGPGSIIASVVMGTDEAGNEETVPPGIAAKILSDLSALEWEGSVVLAEAECSFTVRPGNALLFTGAKARAGWSTMRASVQQVDLDLVTGRTTISIGPPSHLSPQDMIAILSQAKDNRPPASPPNPGGGPGGGGGFGGGKPAQPQELELCDGNTINVLLAN